MAVMLLLIAVIMRVAGGGVLLMYTVCGRLLRVLNDADIRINRMITAGCKLIRQ